MIGTKTLAVTAVAAVTGAIAAGLGLLSPAHVVGLTADSCLVIGLFAALLTALAAPGWRPGKPSRTAVGWRGGRLVAEPGPGRELPGWLQQALLAGVFLCIGLGTFSNEATARLTGLPEVLARQSTSKFCPEETVEAAEQAPAPVPPPPEIQGCALVRRAFEMGYAKSLGECAPRKVEVVQAQVEQREICHLRQPDEPFLHYSWRRLAGGAGGLSGMDPAGAVSGKVDEIRTRMDYLDTLVNSQLHSLTGTAHSAHHLWVNLPDPRPPRSWSQKLLEREDCNARHAARPVWPEVAGHEQPASALVDHVFGQLLFDPRYGDAPGSCTEYTIHWDAPADACSRLADDPEGFLGEQGALEGVRDVLDRHHRQLEVRRLHDELGERQNRDAPPDARTLVSLQCYVIDPGGKRVSSGREVLIAGYGLPVRELRTPAIEPAGAGAIAVYVELADLLAGFRYGGPATESTLDRIAAQPPTAGDLGQPDFLLARLEQLHEIDPFTGARWPLDQSDLREVYPVQRHLRSFIDAFRKRYWAQRGRL